MSDRDPTTLAGHFASRGLDVVSDTDLPCMACGARQAIFLNTELVFDFDANVIPNDLRPVFTTRKDGVCFNCGLYQDFVRYSASEMQRFCAFNKDETVSESAYRQIPVPTDYIAGFEAQNMNQRIRRWDKYFSNIDKADLRQCLFLRPMFGAAPLFVKERFKADVFALEISRACRMTTEERVPGIQFLEGQIHGRFEGAFLKSGPYDAVFVFHTLIHCIDIRDSLNKVFALLKPGGAAIFSHEVQLKPHNPFHIIFPTEYQLTKLLGEYFNQVDRIDDCDPNPPPFIRDYSMRGDSPDLVAWTGL